jgi:hypothetical protein
VPPSKKQNIASLLQSAFLVRRAVILHAALRAGVGDAGGFQAARGADRAQVEGRGGVGLGGEGRGDAGGEGGGWR